MTLPQEEAERTPDKPVVLVVEDIVLVRMGIVDYLAERGFVVVEAGSGEEAVAVLRQEMLLDAVFSDIDLGGALNGFGVARWVRGNRPDLTVVLGSGAMQGELPGEAAHEPPILRKPYDLQQLERRLRAAASRRRGP